MKKYRLSTLPFKLLFIIILVLYSYSIFLILQSSKDYHWLLIVLSFLVWALFLVCTIYFLRCRIVIKDEYLIFYWFKKSKYLIKDIREINVKSNEICIRYKGKIYKHGGYSMFTLYRGFSKK